MGLVGYKRFIEGFSRFSHSITYFQKRGIKFEWTLKCEESFQLLKELLTSAPILNIVDPNEDFVVWTYACKEGFGGVLTQNGHVIFYESINLNERENYATGELGVLATLHALKMWRHYLMGRKFELSTDHSDLKYSFEQQMLNARKTQWLEFQVNMTLLLSVLQERRARLLMHSIEGYMQCILQPLECANHIWRTKF